MPLLLHYIVNSLACIAVSFVATVSNLSRARGADVRIGDSKISCLRIDSAIAKVFMKLILTYLYLLASVKIFFFENLHL